MTQIVYYWYIPYVEYFLLSLVDEALLLLLSESPGISGYTINRLVEQRGYRAWAGIGTSSIYARLKKIEQRGFATSAPDDKKSGRGPQGRLFTLTTEGRKVLEHEVEIGLSTTREHDPRFNLALCGLHLLSKHKVDRLLTKRRYFLATEQRRLERVFESQRDALDRGARLLFERIIHGIAAEIRWLDTVLPEAWP